MILVQDIICYNTMIPSTYDYNTFNINMMFIFPLHAISSI